MGECQGSFTKHQLVTINQNLFIQLITASVMMARDKFIKKLQSSQMAHSTRAYPCFLEGTVSMMIPSWMEYHSIAILLHSISLHLSDNLPLYSLVEGDTVRGKCFAKEHNTSTWPGLKPASLNPKYSLLTITP